MDNFCTIGTGAPGVAGVVGSGGAVYRHSGNSATLAVEERWDLNDYSANTQDAINDAITALPSAGGRVDIYLNADTSINNDIDVNKDNVTLVFHGGGQILMGNNVRGINITSNGATVIGARFQSLTPNAAAQSCILVNGGAVDHSGSDCRIQDCTFDLSTGAVDQEVSAIRLIGHDIARECAGVKITGNTFIIRDTGTAQTAAYGGSIEPNGVNGIRMLNVVDFSLTNNTWKGYAPASDTARSGKAGPCIYLQNCRWGSVHGNHFSDLDLATAGNDGDIIYVTATGGAEGHHLAITGNVFEQVTCNRAIKLQDANYNTISGNNIGRLPNSQGAVEVVNGTSTTIVGNQFHNSADSDYIKFTDHNGWIVDANSFSLVGKDVELVVESGNCRGTIGSNDVKRKHT